MLAQIRTALTHFSPISLADMENVKLLNRVDTKFLMTETQLLDILGTVQDDYYVLANEGTRTSLYRTQYFDTPDFSLYLDHHNDRQDRYKIRSRTYVDSDVTFLEVKHKTNKRRTIKSRTQIPALLYTLEGDDASFVRAASLLNVWTLEPVIWNTFHRITLVSKVRRERLTIDVNLRYGWEDREGGLPNLVIAEVKQRKFSFASDFVQQLRRHHIRRMGFSKYCAGMADVYPHLKANRFKRRQLRIARLQQQGRAESSPALNHTRGDS